MSSTKNVRLAKLLKIFLDFLLGLTILVCIGLVMWVALSPLMLRQFDVVGSASIPVRIGSGAEPQLEVSFQGATDELINDAFLRESEGILYLETGSIALIAAANAAKLVLGGGLIYVLYLLREIVRAIVAGAPFTAEIGQKVRRLGFSVLLLSFISPLAQFIAASEILHRLPVPVPDLAPGPTFDSIYIFLALLILLLSYVWGYGLDLERDRELTV